MNKYWTKSIILHIAVVILLALSGLSFCTHDDDKIEEVTVTVDIMPIGEKTNVKPAPKNEEPPKPTPPKKEEPKEEEEKPKEKEKPKEEPKKEPKPEDKPEIKPDSKPEKTKPEPKKDTKKADDSELDNLLKSLDDKKPVQKTQSKQTENTDTKSKSASDFDPNAPLTVSEIDFIKTIIMRQIVPCWNVPAGARDAGSLQIKLDVDVERDGTIKFVGFSDEARYYADNYYQVAADSARRAVLDPKCNPLKQLPPLEKFNKWHELTLTFDPSKLIY